MNIKVKTSLLVAMIATSTMTFSPVFAEEGVVYYPTYTDQTAHVYTYNPWTQFEINTQVGRVTDIQLRGDEVVQKIATGDNVRFKVDKDMVAGIQHVYVKPVTNNLKTNFIINTNQRVYRLIVNSTRDDGEYVILWEYPDLDKQDRMRKEEEERSRLVAFNNKLNQLSNTKFTQTYTMKAHNVNEEYVPTKIFDDGTKTYIELRRENKNNFPTFYQIDDANKAQLLNYRLKGEFIEIDKVGQKFKIQFSKNSWIEVKRKTETKKADNGKINKQLNNKPVDVVELAKTLTNTPSTIAVQENYTPLKERMYRTNLNTMAELNQASMKPDTKEIDQQIAQLQADLGIGSQSKATPTQKTKDEQEAQDIQIKINRIQEGTK